MKDNIFQIDDIVRNIWSMSYAGVPVGETGIVTKWDPKNPLGEMFEVNNCYGCDPTCWEKVGEYKRETFYK